MSDNHRAMIYAKPRNPSPDAVGQHLLFVLHG